MLDAGDIVVWAKAFAFTELVEVPLYRFLVPSSWGRAIAASAITHPVVWFVFPLIGERLAWSYVLTSIVSEVFAVSVEAIFFQRLCRISWRRALVVSLVANGASVGLGLLVRHTVGVV